MLNPSAAVAVGRRPGNPGRFAARQVFRTPPLPKSSGDDEAPWLPIVAQAVKNYQGYLEAMADRGLAADLRSKVDASDLVQETFAEVYREYYRFVGLSDEEFKALLIRMMMNNLKSFTRRYRGSLKREVSREVPLNGQPEEPGSTLQVAGPEASPSEHIIAEEDLQRLKSQLDRLPERDRLAVTSRVLDGSTYREIGERLGCSGVAARKLCMRVVEKLRRDLSVSLN